MSQATGGSFSYLRRVKTGDYEHHEATMVVNFSITDGAEPTDVKQTFDSAAKFAVGKVNEVLGTRPVAALVSVPQGPAAAVAEPGPVSAPAPAPTPRRRGSAKPPVIDVTLTETEITEAVAARANPAGMEDDKPNISTTPEDRHDPANPADVAETANLAAIGDDDWGAPVEVTDKTLIDAITKKQAAINDALRIRRLIGNFVSPPKGYKDIPAEARQKFLDELAGLV